MSGCTETGKPLISILMAVYEPRMDWLREQLTSLNDQTYPSLRLYVRDDCSPTVPYADIERCVAECITRFPYTIVRNEKNLGSNGTFAQLTREAEGQLFAYCDQDDIWLPEKLTILQEDMERENALLVCSDMYIIDGEGKQVADSITKVRRHHVFRSGTQLAEGLLTHNFVTGCTMLVKASAARRAVPFCPYMVHDHYIALCCAAEGMVYSTPERTIRYRIHGNNQTGIMSGVRDKDSYVRVRVEIPAKAAHWLSEHLPADEALHKTLAQVDFWLSARAAYANGDRNQRREIWRYRRFSPTASLFEICLPYMPTPLFRLALWASKENLI